MAKLEMGRRALIRRFIGKLAIAFGRFRQLKEIDPVRVKRLVFVCRGNVCRSPYAEAAARNLGLSSISCGVDVEYSANAEPLAVQAAFMRGKDIKSHMSRSIFDIHLSDSDFLVAMDPSHLPVCREVAARRDCQLTLFGLWRDHPVAEIADPYGKSFQAFNKCFDEIDAALTGMVKGLKLLKLSCHR